MHDEHQLGPERSFTDPQTGEVIVERPVLLPAPAGQRGLAEKPPAPGFVSVNMDSLWLVHLVVNNITGLLILLEAARQKRMNGGSVTLTTAFRNRHGITRRQSRTAVAELEELAAGSGWVRLSRTAHSAVTVEVTDLGMRQLWHPGRK